MKTTGSMNLQTLTILNICDLTFAAEKVPSRNSKYTDRYALSILAIMYTSSLRGQMYTGHQTV